MFSLTFPIPYYIINLNQFKSIHDIYCHQGMKYETFMYSCLFLLFMWNIDLQPFTAKHSYSFLSLQLIQQYVIAIINHYQLPYLELDFLVLILSDPVNHTDKMVEQIVLKYGPSTISSHAHHYYLCYCLQFLPMSFPFLPALIFTTGPSHKNVWCSFYKAK